MCTHCDDTGSLSRSVLGGLDCAYCDVAEERVALARWLREQQLLCNDIDAWLIYQHGARAARSAKA